MDKDIQLTQLDSIRAAIKDNLKTVGPTVQSALVEVATKKEVERRVAAQSVLEKIEETEKELKKIKPTYAGYDLQGKGVGEPIYTKEQADSYKKLNEQGAKLHSALEKALTESDFTKVLELGGEND